MFVDFRPIGGIRRNHYSCLALGRTSKKPIFLGKGKVKIVYFWNRGPPVVL